MDDQTKKSQTADPVIPDPDDTTIIHPATPPSVVGEQSVSGDMPAPESDDDTLANAQVVGQQLDEDEEHPQPVDIARDMDTAEEYKRTH